MALKKASISNCNNGNGVPSTNGHTIKPPKANNLNNKLRPRSKQRPRQQQVLQPATNGGQANGRGEEDDDEEEASEIDSDEFQDESEEELVDLESLISSIGSDDDEEEEEDDEDSGDSEGSSDVVVPAVPRSHEMKTRGVGNNNLRANGLGGRGGATRRLRNHSTGSEPVISNGHGGSSPKRKRYSSKHEFDDDEVTFR